jgi:tyrosine-protein kinase Etk/Wzc
VSRVLRYIQVLLKWRSLILVNTLGLALIGVALSFILPARYSATARLLPPPEDDLFGLTSVLSGGMAGGLSRLRSGFMSMATPSDVMLGILGGRTIAERVVERCSIIEYYGIRDSSMEEAMTQLGRMTSMTAGDEGIVSISVEAKTPELAASVGNAYVEELDLFLRTSNISRGRNTRVFIEGRLAEVEAALDAAKESLVVYQRRHHMISLDQELRAAVDAYAELKSQLYVKEAKLGMVERTWSADNPYVLSLQREIAAFGNQLRRLEEGQSVDGFGAGFAVSFRDLPEAAAGLLTRYRELRIQEESFALLYQQYEYAKIMEARDTPTTTVLDYAVPPERRSFPIRKRIVAIFVLFGLAVSSAFAFVVEYFHSIRSTQTEEFDLWRDTARQVKEAVRSLLAPFSRRNR